MKKIGLTLFCLICLSVISFAQIEDPQIKEELQKRGIEESTVKEELDKRNLDEDDVKRELEERGLLNTTGQNIKDPQSRVENEERLRMEYEKQKAAEKAKEDAKKESEKPTEPKATGPRERTEEVEEEDLIYGQQLFKGNDFGLIEETENFKAPDSYIVGAGDEFSVAAWGLNDFSSSYRVNKDGYIKPFQLPRIYLKGLTFDQARESIFSAFSRVMSDLRSGATQMEVTLTYSRPITIGIYGEVEDPGSYTFSAFNTAFNALSAAGGPNLNGSVRQIKVIHTDQTEELVDLYQYLNSPNEGTNKALTDNDIVFVPTAGKQVTLEGAVTRPYKYELLEGEGLIDLIRYAGGLRPEAYRNNIQVQRFENDQQILVDVNLIDLIRNDADFALQNGDKVSIYVVEEPFQNFVTITGAVELEGEYQLVDNMRLSDLVKKSGLREDAKTDQIYILRKEQDLSNTYIRVNLFNAMLDSDSPDNLFLRPRDNIRVSSKSIFVTEYEVKIDGEVRNPGVYPFDENLQVSDLLFFGGGPKLEAADIGVLQRVKPDGTSAFVRVDLQAIIADPDSPENIQLRPKDELVVYPKSSFSEQFQVEVFGAVRNPGPFNYFKDMTLKDLLFIAGGLREEAANNRIEVSRIITDGSDDEKTRVVMATLTVDDSLNITVGGDAENQFRLSPRDQVFVRSLPEFEVQRNVMVTGEVVFPGAYPLLSKEERLHSLISRAGDLTETAFPGGATLIREQDSIGFVLLDLEQVMKNPKSRFNYVLKDGDIINIPKVKDLVSITGAVKYPAIDTLGSINVPYHKGKKARYYVNHYGTGVDKKKRGRKKLIIVADPNGFVKKTKRVAFFHFYPKVEKGSTVAVQAKPKRRRAEREDREPIKWSQVITDSVTGATAILTLILLIDRVGQ